MNYPNWIDISALVRDLEFVCKAHKLTCRIIGLPVNGEYGWGCHIVDRLGETMDGQGLTVAEAIMNVQVELGNYLERKKKP